MIATAARLHFMSLSGPDPHGLDEHQAASIHVCVAAPCRPRCCRGCSCLTRGLSFQVHAGVSLLPHSQRVPQRHRPLQAGALQAVRPSALAHPPPPPPPSSNPPHSWCRFLKLLLFALHKIPPTVKTLYRGVAKALVQLTQKFEKGKHVVWWAVTSTASHVSVLENPQFLGKSGDRCMFSIAAVSARDIQRYSAMGSTEREFVLSPGCCLVVEDILDAGHGLTIVQLAEDASMKLLKLQGLSAPASAPAPSPSPAPSPAPATAGGGAASAGDDVEEELQELVSEMVKLKLGLKKACITFAGSLALAGVMSLEELRAYPSAKARGFLE